MYSSGPSRFTGGNSSFETLFMLINSGFLDGWWCVKLFMLINSSLEPWIMLINSSSCMVVW